MGYADGDSDYETSWEELSNLSKNINSYYEVFLAIHR